MAYPAVSKTFVDATLASADDVNQNFTDIINGVSDGTKDLNVANLIASGVSTSVEFNTPTLGVTGTLTVGGLLQGSRQFFVWFNQVEGNGSGYLYGSINSATTGTAVDRVVMPRAGSIVAITVGQYTSACANAQTMTPQIVGATGGTVSAATITVSAAVTGARAGVASTFARGANTFNAGDTLTGYVVMSGTAGSAAMKAFVSIGAEVVFNT
jgi:hypothetical protein